MFKIYLQSLCALMMFTFSTQGFSQQIINTLDKTAQDNLIWKKISKGTATWLFMDIYDATLFAGQDSLPTNFLAEGVPLKLELCYLKSITPDIFIKGANAKLPEKLSKPLQKEVDRLHQSYQTVEPGDCYDLEYTQALGTQLKLNGTSVFNSQEPEFKAVYFGIWLGDNPLSDSLKQRLVRGH